MHKAALLALIFTVSFPAMAEILPCDALKARVDAKLQAKGVPAYTLEILPAESNMNIDAASGIAATKKSKGKEVGTCEGGTKRLMYTRGN
jgi:hypothetical protein